jgi:replicative DNA helicase
LIDIGEDVVNDAYRPDVDTPALQAIETAEQRLYDLATAGEADRGFRHFKSTLASAIAMAEAAFRREGHIAGVATGLDDLDKLLGGLHPSDLVILAGRPGMGKTALATNIAFNAAERDSGNAGKPGGAHIGFFSLEMSAEQLATRILSEKSGVSSERIRRGDLSGTDFEKVVLAARALESTNLYIDDTPALSVSAVRSRARRLQRQHGLDMIVVDYLQLLRPTSGGSSRPENRVQEISDITRNLKAIAKELNIPVLALSQLSRAVEQREDKRPQLSDLRESGTIEQDADVVMFVFREEYYLERAEPSQRPDEAQDKFNDRYANWQERLKNTLALAELHIAKQRHGPTGKVLLHFESATTRFSNHGASEHMPDVRG